MSKLGEGDGFNVRVDFDRILETIAARIYDNQFAFLRENVQNAIDAIRIQARRESRSSENPAYRIDISVVDREATIADNGIGMTRAQLVANFWTMGASGKNTDEARAAGCIGTFGIGGFANFGVCETLEVVSRSAECSTAHATSLSRVAFGVDRYALPKVSYSETDARLERGTTVKGVGKDAFDAAALLAYIRPFVRHVGEAIYFNGEKISQATFDGPGKRDPIAQIRPQDADGLGASLFRDGDTLSAEVVSLAEAGVEFKCSGYVRLVNGELAVYKRGFLLCSINVSSNIGISGWLDCDALKPTAGRDTLDSSSIALLNRIFSRVEWAASDQILSDSELLANHVRMIPEFMRRGWLEKLGKLRVDLLGEGSATLDEIRNLVGGARRVYYTLRARGNSALEVLAARGHFVVKLSGNSQRRHAESAFLRQFCAGQEFDGLLECLEVYADLDAFERNVLTELSLSIKKLFKPPEFRLVPGKLTLDTPIYWSGKLEEGVVLVFVDTRHGELQKLKPLGYSGLFWSMMEAFCREYLSDTLRRESLRFFGSGAIDLDDFSKANSELWELVVDDIEVSRLGVEAAVRPGGGRTELVRQADVTRLTISDAGGVVAGETGQEAAGAKRYPKILQIVDAAGTTGLAGYYLRIPESASAAFGHIIRPFPAFSAVWYANRITWHGTDLESTAFVFDVTLDRLVGRSADGGAAHGAYELSATQVHTYDGQIYFFIPPMVQDHVVPRTPAEVIRIQIRHELVDLNRSRAWTSKERSQ